MPADPRARVDALWARGSAFLGTETALLGGAMSWVSERNLVAAISNAGGFGVIACGSMTPALLAAEINAVDIDANALVAGSLVCVEGNDAADAHGQRRLARLEGGDAQRRDGAILKAQQAAGVRIFQILRADN
mgnify:CR=1 FL=1